MPNKPNSGSPPKDAPRSGASFRQRYDELENGRDELIARLGTLNEASRKHAGFKRAQKLLNETFRKSSLAQRFGILQAASWLIDILEQIPFLL
ncbi:MAG: hypothetical protein WCI56_14980 [Hyphomicrobiales bacterium]